jgi:hypothetical protein
MGEVGGKLKELDMKEGSEKTAKKVSSCGEHREKNGG